MKIHIVKPGDTLYEIAKKHNVDLQKLIDMNSQLEDPNLIMPGMKIKVPSTSLPVAPPVIDPAKKHIVVQGDTLWKLSQAWGVPLKAVVDANPQLKNPSVLMTGEVVYIPQHAEMHGQHGSGMTPAQPMPAGSHKKSTAPMPELVMSEEYLPPPVVEEPVEHLFKQEKIEAVEVMQQEEVVVVEQPVVHLPKPQPKPVQPLKPHYQPPTHTMPIMQKPMKPEPVVKTPKMAEPYVESVGEGMHVNSMMLVYPGLSNQWWSEDDCTPMVEPAQAPCPCPPGMQVMPAQTWKPVQMEEECPPGMQMMPMQTWKPMQMEGDCKLGPMSGPLLGEEVCKEPEMYSYSFGNQAPQTDEPIQGHLSSTYNIDTSRPISYAPHASWAQGNTEENESSEPVKERKGTKKKSGSRKRKPAGHHKASTSHKESKPNLPWIRI